MDMIINANNLCIWQCIVSYTTLINDPPILLKKLYLGTRHDSIQLDIHKNYKYGYLKMHTNKILFSSSNKNHSSQFQSTWPHNQREDMLWQITNYTRQIIIACTWHPQLMQGCASVNSWIKQVIMACTQVIQAHTLANRCIKQVVTACTTNDTSTCFGKSCIKQVIVACTWWAHWTDVRKSLGNSMDKISNCGKHMTNARVIWGRPSMLHKPSNQWEQFWLVIKFKTKYMMRLGSQSHTC